MAFFSTYALYKEGTRAIVNWLTATAARCGYETLQQKKKKKNKNKNRNRKLKAKGLLPTRKAQSLLLRLNRSHNLL
jgi:trans-aconitate methyltransferase